MQPSASPVPPQRPAVVRTNRLAPGQAWPERVQHVLLLLIAEHGYADQATLATILPDTDRRDLIEAVEALLEHGLLRAPPQPPDSLATLAAQGLLLITFTGRRWLDADVA